MATSFIAKSFAEEKLIWYGLVATYPIYLLGGLYVTGSVIGWLILGIVLLRMYINPDEAEFHITPMVWCWIVAMLVMLIALWVGHANWSLGTGKTIKSSIGWAKGWALMALFILVGCLAPIRKEILIRGVCILAIHTLIFSFISVLAYIVRLPGELFVSPLQIVGGPGPNFFTVSLYGYNPETGAGRWSFFGPWSPAAGMLSCLYLVICMQEKDVRLRNWAVLGCTAMCLLSQSRAGWAIFIMLWPMMLLADKFKHPGFLLFLGLFLPALFILGQPVFEWVMDSYQQVKDARPDSTRVRAALANIALQRWQAEAFYFGHGIVEPGPKIVEGMPIGSHHSWYGLLFVKGLVGFLALAIPMFLTSVYLFWQSQTSTMAHTALCLMAVFVCYSFFENLEILSYLYWPALVWIGMCLNPLKLAEQD